MGGKKIADKNNANIGFEKQIWDATCVLWGHIPSAEYRKVIVGLIFLRYISSSFEKRYQKLVAEGYGFEDDRDAYAEENVFYVPEEARWNRISSAAHTLEIGTSLISLINGELIPIALDIFNQCNPQLDKYF
ncbi:type I restriction-modification system subunit M N-terminal domain-containing protein [Thomasclavelia cocleata]|uniref:type I restriction-modification system subunit M N-terminal domain-containing protein n=1 Tax=Thomasclavelia cocleata TaxID=69824 RepID=UPI003D111CFD